MTVMSSILWHDFFIVKNSILIVVIVVSVLTVVSVMTVVTVIMGLVFIISTAI